MNPHNSIGIIAERESPTTPITVPKIIADIASAIFLLRDRERKAVGIITMLIKFWYALPALPIP
ncbi:hypothetical protein OAX97_02770, partial [Gammaproteobacteria bacterium]|nr:hypothetical protein [Gammaproteobacteria bacterium]